MRAYDVKKREVKKPGQNFCIITTKTIRPSDKIKAFIRDFGICKKTLQLFITLCLNNDKNQTNDNLTRPPNSPG